MVLLLTCAQWLHVGVGAEANDGPLGGQGAGAAMGEGMLAPGKGSCFHPGSPGRLRVPIVPNALECLTRVTGKIPAPCRVTQVPAAKANGTVHCSPTHGGLLALGSCWQCCTFRKSSTSWGSSLLWYRTPCRAPERGWSAPQKK